MWLCCRIRRVQSTHSILLSSCHICCILEGLLWLVWVRIIPLPISTLLLFISCLSQSLLSKMRETLTYPPAPWVHPSHSSAPLMQVVDKLPTSWIGNFHHMHSFVGNWVAPSIAFSSAKMGVKPSLSGEESQKWYGMNAAVWDEVGKVQMKWQGKEDMRYVLFSFFT